MLVSKRYCILTGCRRLSKLCFSVGYGIYFRQGTSELWKEEFQYDGLDILRDIRQITA